MDANEQRNISVVQIVQRKVKILACWCKNVRGSPKSLVIIMWMIWYFWTRFHEWWEKLQSPYDTTHSFLPLCITTHTHWLFCSSTNAADGCESRAAESQKWCNSGEDLSLKAEKAERKHSFREAAGWKHSELMSPKQLWQFSWRISNKPTTVSLWTSETSRAGNRPVEKLMMPRLSHELLHRNTVCWKMSWRCEYD